MRYTHTRRTLVTIVAASSIAVPAAASGPDGPPATPGSDAAQSASLAATDGARAAVARHTVVSAQDLRSEASADTSRAPKTALGAPTWPVNPKPLTPVSQPPVADGIGDGDGIDWRLSVLALFGSLLTGGSLGVAGMRYRTARNHATG